MSEALEWRIEKLKATITLMCAWIVQLLAAVLIVVSQGMIPFVGGISIYLVGTGLYSIGLASTSDGYNRRFWKAIIGGIEMPPLDEWGDRLEERGAFGYQETVADGGEKK